MYISGAKDFSFHSHFKKLDFHFIFCQNQVILSVKIYYYFVLFFFCEVCVIGKKNLKTEHKVGKIHVDILNAPHFFITMLF